MGGLHGQEGGGAGAVRSGGTGVAVAWMSAGAVRRGSGAGVVDGVVVDCGGGVRVSLHSRFYERMGTCGVHQCCGLQVCAPAGAVGCCRLEVP